MSILVPQDMEYVVEQSGQYKCTLKAGKHSLSPFFEKVVNKVSMKEQIIEARLQPVITKDNVTLKISVTTLFRVCDSKKFTYDVKDAPIALNKIVIKALRDVVNEVKLDDVYTLKQTINDIVIGLIDGFAEKAGVEILKVEITEIVLPEEIVKAMEKIMNS